MYHTPGELSLTDPGGAYLLYFLFQAFYSGTWPSLPSKFFYSSAMSNITFLIPGPDGMGKLTSQFGEIAADEPRKVYTLAGSYTLPGGAWGGVHWGCWTGAASPSVAAWGRKWAQWSADEN